MTQTPETDPRVDAWLAQAPAWQDILTALRALVHKAGLQETLKWGKPCYVHNGANVAIIYHFKESAAIGFFKGALLHGPAGLLAAPGENSQAMRMARFTTVQAVEQASEALSALLRDAVALEDAGIDVPFAPPAAQPTPQELTDRLAADAVLRTAFESLTPGRRRAYALYLGQAKQSATRLARLERCVPLILEGLGPNERG